MGPMPLVTDVALLALVVWMLTEGAMALRRKPGSDGAADEVQEDEDQHAGHRDV